MRFTALAILAAAAFAASAQEPPTRVGRLAYVEGPVSVYQDPDIGWDKAYVNTPLTSENSIWADRGARAELRVSATAVRLDEGTQLDVSRLDDQALDAQVTSGAVFVRVRYKESDESISISTPQAAFLLERDGAYRIDYDPARDESRLTVFSGSARMRGESGDVLVPTGRTVHLFGGPEPTYGMEPAAPADAFDRWAQSRDRLWHDNAARTYVSPYMTGYEDLDTYGQWSSDPDYGTVWYPSNLASDWAPYRDGRWSYVQPWGWTWVDDAPWGYAPFHYGRWVQVRNRWAWAPGPRQARPVWAPALVAWIGGANWSVSVSGRNAPAVGWYPLAPWERYQPWFHTGPRYADRVNVAVRDHPPRDWHGSGDEWRHWNRDRAATVVSRDTMVDRRPVQHDRVRVSPDAVRQQPVVAAAALPQVLPQRNELERAHNQNRQPAAAPTVANPPRNPGAAAAPQAQPNAVARPDFQHARAAKPAPAPQSTSAATRPPSPGLAPLPSNPVTRQGNAPQATPAARPPAPPPVEQQRQAQPRDQQQREAQQRDTQQREAQQREAQQRQSQEAQQRQAQEAQQRAATQQQQHQHQQQQPQPQPQQPQQAQQRPQPHEAPAKEKEKEKEKEKDAKEDKQR